MQIKEKLRDVALFVLGSFLTCAFVLISSKIQVAEHAAPHLETLSSKYPDAVHFTQQLIRLATEADKRVDVGLAANQSLCWNLAGTELDLITVLDNGRFVKPEAPILYTDISTEVIAANEMTEESSEANVEPSASEDASILDCRYEVLVPSTRIASNEVSQPSEFATSANRLFCETLESTHELNPAENRDFLTISSSRF